MTSTERLTSRIRVYIFVMVACFFLQGAFLASALRSDGSATAWIVWGVVLAFCVPAAIYAGISADKLSKQYRKSKWGAE